MRKKHIAEPASAKQILTELGILSKSVMRRMKVQLGEENPLWHYLQDLQNDMQSKEKPESVGRKRRKSDKK